MIIRRCVPEIEQSGIMEKGQLSPYGEHFAGDKQPRKFFNRIFIGLLYSKTVLNG